MSTKRFTGQYHESSLPGGEGLSYYNARWYDPQLGRFLSADTIVPIQTNPQALNRYTYTFNNPTNFTDSSGHCVDGVSTAVCLAAGGALVGGTVGATWWAINESMYGEIDLSVNLVWAEDSWIPGLHTGDDWGELGAATTNGAAAGFLIPFGGLAAAAGTGIAVNAVADHTLYSLTGQGSSAAEQMAHGVAGAMAGTLGYSYGTVIDGVINSAKVRTVYKVVTNGFNAGVIDTAADIAVNGEPDRLELAAKLYGNAGWNIAGETYGILSYIPRFPSPRSADYWGFFIASSWKVKETTIRAGIVEYQRFTSDHLRSTQH